MGLTDKTPFKIIEANNNDNNKNKKGKTKHEAKVNGRDVDKKTKDTTDKPAKTQRVKTISLQLLGIFLIVLMVTMFMQGLPLIVAFTGAYLGIPVTGDIPTADIIVWMSTNFGLILIILYGVIKLSSMTFNKLVRK